MHVLLHDVMQALDVADLVEAVGLEVFETKRLREQSWPPMSMTVLTEGTSQRAPLPWQAISETAS